MFEILSGLRKMSFIQGRDNRSIAPASLRWVVSGVFAASLSVFAASAAAAPKSMSKAPRPAPKFVTILDGATGLPANAYPFISEAEFQ